MKRKFLFGFGFLALAIATPLALTTPVLADLQEVGEAIVEKIRQPEVKLVMSAEKQVAIVDEDGQSKLVWEALEGDITVQPGDVLKYVVASENEGEMSAENLIVAQKIEPQMTYVLGSAEGNEIADITYSIDGGETFVAEPMVEVTLPDGTIKLQPAPAEAYTDVKWDFSKTLETEEAVSVSHQVTIK